MSPHESLNIIREEHTALSSVLRSLTLMLKRGPDGDEPRFFDVMRAMLFYIDEFPERRHHPKESDLLFPRIAKSHPDAFATISRLERDHLRGEDAVRHLQHLLLAWELLGESRRQAFADELERYVGFYLDHMRVEEEEILPLAEQTLTGEEWAQLDRAFAANGDPLTGRNPPEAGYDRLFTRIVMTAPAPIGLGRE